LARLEISYMNDGLTKLYTSSRFQAVECFLANVKSTITDEPNTWQKSSISKFEELTEGK